MKSNAGGKGSGRRPTQVDTATADANWDRIFGNKKKRNESDQVSPNDNTVKEQKQQQ